MVLNGARHIIMLSKFGEENMKNNLERCRRVMNALFKEHLNCYMELMSLDVKPEEVRCSAKEVFKTFELFHLVTVHSDGRKSTC